MRRLTVALRWPVGVLLTAWSYMWRTTPLWRREIEGTWPADAPRDVDPSAPRADVQAAGDGVGPLFRRRYRARIHDASVDAAALIADVAADPNRVAPGTLAHFQKEAGEEG